MKDGWVVVLTTVDYDEALMVAGALDGEGIPVVMPEDPRRYVRMGSAPPAFGSGIDLHVPPDQVERARAIVAVQRRGTLPPGFADDDVQEWLDTRVHRRRTGTATRAQLALMAAFVAAVIGGALVGLVRSLP